MHTGFSVEFDHAWLAGRGFPRERGRTLLRLLAELAQSGSLREAAQRAGVSYRAAWGALGDGSRLFGAPLVDMKRGRRASLSALGRRVLEADERVRRGLGEQFERLRVEIPALLSEALPGARPRLALHASHDLALAALRDLCRPVLELEIVVRGADESLAALARGECDLAGFHVADALPRAAAAAAALGRWLDPRKHILIHFVTREQGLIARPGSRIRGVHDLARPGVRFIHRQSREGEERSVAEAVAAGRADAGFGLRADATRHRLGFTPLATERYYFACARAALRGAALKALLDALGNDTFARHVARLPGYNAEHAGRREALDAALTWVQRA
ncbi:MAG TPA: substrate-binding domain-containing protein [Burkholderiales bacterium]|nr:substrate-binding domain-containing protein [Burkholderiales bacterium]